MRASCSLCAYDIDIRSGGFTMCLICNTSYLCTKCSISQDLNLCSACVEEQVEQTKEAKEAKRKCIRCLIAREVNCECKHCSLYWFCQKCYDSHPCFCCQECRCVGIFQRCCGLKRCSTCHSKHETTNCLKTMYRICDDCNKRSYIFRCPVSGCVQRGCDSVGCNILHRFNKTTGVYCRFHTSENNCPGCKLAYPLDRALGYGNVQVLSLLGARVKKKRILRGLHEKDWCVGGKCFDYCAQTRRRRRECNISQSFD